MVPNRPIVPSFLVNVCHGPYSVALISTADKAFTEKFKRWAELEGYQVDLPEDFDDDGPKHK